jgi:hypothetical protein
MYSKEEAARIRSEFWTTYGKYMRPVPSVLEQKVNWVNYKSDVRFIRLIQDVDRKQAEISIILNTTEEQLIQQVKPLMKEMFVELEAKKEYEWLYDSNYYRNGVRYERIFTFIEGVNIYNKDTWPDIIAFFKHSMIQADRVWASYKEMFQMFQDN